MASLNLIDSGIVYINPEPGYEYHFACHSHVVPLGGDDLLCTFQRGQALYSRDSVLVPSRSIDGGRTWAAETLIHDPAGDDRPYSYHGPMGCRMADGELVVNAMRIDRSDPDQALFNLETGGIFETDTMLYRSMDNGDTWDEQLFQPPDDMILTPSCAMLELADGRWFQAFDQWHGYDDPGPYRPCTVGLFSDDRGATWGDPVSFATNLAGGKGCWHGRIIRLHDDRLFTLFWTGDMESGGALSLHYCHGSPDGTEWSDPQPTNIPGQTNWPIDFGDGRMAVIYTVRATEPPGFFAAVSEDGGTTWDLDNQIHVWDATGRQTIGVDSPDKYPRSHDTIAYGAPTSAVLDNGDMLCSMWCTEVSVTHIRYVRLRPA